MLPNSSSTTQGTSTTGNSGGKLPVPMTTNLTTPTSTRGTSVVDLNQARDARPGRAVATLVCSTGETSLTSSNGDSSASPEFTGFRRAEADTGGQVAPVVTTVVESNAALARHENAEAFEKLSPDAIKQLVRGAARLKSERSKQRDNGEIQLLTEEEATDEARSLDERFRDQMFGNNAYAGQDYADDEDDEYLDALDMFYMQYVDCILADNDEARRLVEFEPQVATELLIYLTKEFE